MENRRLLYGIGKNIYIISNTVCHDADLETAVDVAIAGAYANTGQSYIVIFLKFLYFNFLL